MKVRLWLSVAALATAVGCFPDLGADDDNDTPAGGSSDQAPIITGSGGRNVKEVTTSGTAAKTGSGAGGGGGVGGKAGPSNSGGAGGATGASGATGAGGAIGPAPDAGHADAGAGVDACTGDLRIMDEADRVRIAKCTRIIGSLTIDAPALTSVELPLLKSVSNLLDVESTNVALTHVSLPALESIAGPLDITCDPGSVLAQIDLPELTSAYTIQLVNSAVGVLEAPKLSHVETALYAKDNPALTGLVFPKLASIAGLWLVVDNPQLDALEFPELITVGEIDVTGNPMLPTCQVQALRDQLQGFSGNAMISGNDDAATCP